VRAPLSLPELKVLGPAYWWVVGVAVMFSIARFSEAFLILRAQYIGLPVALAPMVLVLMNVFYALAVARPAEAVEGSAIREFFHLLHRTIKPLMKCTSRLRRSSLATPT
jgi:hypothetical protein